MSRVVGIGLAAMLAIGVLAAVVASPPALPQAS